MKIRPYLFSLLALAFALILSLAIGSVFLSPAQLWAALTGHGTQTSNTILWAIRFPRTALIVVNWHGIWAEAALHIKDYSVTRWLIPF